MHQRSHFEYFFKIKVTFSDQSTLVLRLECDKLNFRGREGVYFDVSV